MVVGELVKLKNKNKKIGIYILAGILLVASIFLTNLNRYKTVSTTSSSIMLDSSVEYKMNKYSGGVVLCGHDSIMGIDKDGQKIWNIPTNFSKPILSCSNNYILTADRNGKHGFVLSEGKIINNIETSDVIITAKINESGYYALAYKEKGYKAKVSVFSPKGEEIYAWYSSNYNVVDVSVSSDNKKMAVAVLDASGSNDLSGVLLFSFKSDEYILSGTSNDNLISSINYINNNVVAVGDKKTLSISHKGEIYWEIDYKGRILQEYSIASDVAFGFTKGSVEGFYGGSVVEIYNKSGKLIGKHEIGDSIRYMDMEGNNVLVNAENGAVLLNDNGKVVKEIKPHKEIRKAVVFGSKFMVLSGNNGFIYDTQ